MLLFCSLWLSGFSCVDPPPVWIPNVEFQINMKLIREMDILESKMEYVREWEYLIFEEMISERV